jgi:predicted solute-binding protein
LIPLLRNAAFAIGNEAALRHDVVDVKKVDDVGAEWDRKESSCCTLSEESGRKW